ncbi:hypothetical protein [Paracoccus sp. (in: a-proteobacteria)]|uniref:hypothetical protein n=1 Tax=Paracoccus sp. TaxID=267 RepID=UPI0026E07E7F|nr:hypothetical protein [Paracoccus sp. (in: a-proteobacteria)]MDO5646309.1 hypothetical protein [Paracoccus sp. (in: a-proteobacteria)]
MAIKSPYLAHEAGVPGQWKDNIDPVREGLIVGNPDVVTVDAVVAANQTIVAPYTPVMRNASGQLVVAAKGTAAVGILLRPITTGTGPAQGQPLLIQAGVDMGMIAWPATYATEADKLNAFVGAATPTAIVVKKSYLGATVAQP